MLGRHPELAAAATPAVKNRAVIDAATLARLRGGDWGGLRDADPVAASADV